MKAGEPFPVNNLKSNSAKLWIRIINFQNGLDYEKSNKVIVLDPIRDSKRFWREMKTEQEVTLEPGTYEIKEIWSGVTQIIQVTEEEVWLLEVTDDKIMRIRPQDLEDPKIKELFYQFKDKGVINQGEENILSV